MLLHDKFILSKNRFKETVVKLGFHPVFGTRSVKLTNMNSIFIIKYVRLEPIAYAYDASVMLVFLLRKVK